MLCPQCFGHDARKDTHMVDTPEDAGNGALFRNERREKPSQPEYRGEAIVDGKRYWVAAWIKEKDGRRFFSLAFRPKEARPKPRPSGASFDRRLDDGGETPF